jgi:hypothetical protein
MLKILSISCVVLMFSAAHTLADQTATDLHLCNADEITSVPALQSEEAYDCTNDTNTEATPKALMCGTGGKAFCCTQKLTELGDCKPVTAGKKRSVPLRDPSLAPQTAPAPMQNTTP